MVKLPPVKDVAKVVVASASKKWVIVPLLGVLSSIALPILLVGLSVMLLAGATTNASSCDTGATSQPGNNTEQAYRYLVNQPELDLKPFQAAAIVGNFIHESGKDPISTNNPNPTSGATGIGHWLGSRLTGLIQYKYEGRHWTDLDLQLDYLRYELLGPERSSLLALKRTTTLTDATAVFERKFERSGDIGSYPRRIAYAQSVQDRYGKATGNQAVEVAECNSEAIDGTLKDPGEGPQDPNNGNLVPRASNLRQLILNRWGCESINRTPCVREIGGYAVRPAGTPQDHTQGLALDVTISDGIGVYPDSSQLAMGWEMACFIAVNAKGLGVRYQIWQGLIWNVDRTSEGGPGKCIGSNTGWRPYTSGFGVTAGHYDHNHITVQPGVGG